MIINNILVFLLTLNLVRGMCLIPNPPFKCEISRSTRPPIAQRLHPSHISVVASMGDSITTGFFMTWKEYPFFHQLYECKPRSYSNGGKSKSVITTIKKYNDGVIGESCEKSSLSGQDSGFNYARAGSFAKNMKEQAWKFVDDMNGKERPPEKEEKWSVRNMFRFKKPPKTTGPPRRSYADDWKLVNLWIGNMEICYSIDPDVYEAQIRETIEIIRRGTRRVFINLILNLEVADIYDMSGKNPVCLLTQTLTTMCPAAFEKKYAKSRMHMRARRKELNQRLIDIAQEYAAMNDPQFMVAVQAGVATMNFKEYKAYKVLSLWDCFHPNRCGNEQIAMRLWKSMFTPLEEDLETGEVASWYCPSSDDYLQ